MKAFYSLRGNPKKRRLHLLREGRERPRPSWRSDLGPSKEGWCGVAGWDRSDDDGRVAIAIAPEEPPGRLKWCPTCVGRVLEEVGMLSAVGQMLARKLADDVEVKRDGGTVRSEDGRTS